MGYVFGHADELLYIIEQAIESCKKLAGDIEHWRNYGKL